MGDKPSSGNQVMQTQSTNTSGPNPFIAGKLESLIGGKGGAWEWIGNNFNAPAYFPGGTVAPRTAADLSASNSAWTWGNTELNTQDAKFAPSIGYLSDAAGGKYLDLESNPYFQGAIKASLDPVTENFNKNIIPNLRAQFASAGRPGAGLEQDKISDAVLNFSRATADAATKAGNEAYGMERGLQSGAATALPGVLANKTGQAQSWLDVLRGVGAESNTEQQRLLDAANAKYSYDTTGQLDWYTRLAQSLQSMYPGGSTSGSGTSYGTGSPAGGGAGSFLGPAMSAVGMALPFLPGFGLSDRRDKTDIEELGVDPLTGLKQYSYRYKGDPKNYPKIVGPMAQDIEKVRPDLVREIGGHKVVDMRALQPSGGLM